MWRLEWGAQYLGDDVGAHAPGEGPCHASDPAVADLPGGAKRQFLPVDSWAGQSLAQKRGLAKMSFSHVPW